MINILSCGEMVRGYKQYHCSNLNCSHTKTVSFGCKSRFCPTCGKKATDVWVNQQRSILPQTDWQHITFTLPDKLWPLFQVDRKLLNQLAKLAANVIMELAKKKKLKVAVFTAIHTFGRDLKWHVHIHLSVTMGGLSPDHTQWKSIRFSKKAVMPMWRYRVMKMMNLAKAQNRICVSHAFLQTQYHKNWIVHFSKPTSTPWRTITYLGRYIKRPPLSSSRLEHYDGNRVIFSYLNHRIGKYQNAIYSPTDFLMRFIQHIPDKGFRLIRYYGILANRVRGSLLPIVYQLIHQTVKKPSFIGWARLMKAFLNINPLQCILCKSSLTFTGMNFGFDFQQLKIKHEKIATGKNLTL